MTPDPRHEKRIRIVQDLFAQSFLAQKTREKTTQKILDQQSVIDKKIQSAAPDWPLDKIAKVDLAILRLAVYELHERSAPPRVIIDEAVELAKEMGGERSGPFVNGVLGTILKKKKE